MMDFVTCMRSTWFNSLVWKPVNHCSYQQLVRTNNDVDGCRTVERRLNKRCVTVHPAIYKLLGVIYSEVPLIEFTANLLSSNAVGMTRSKKTSEKQARLISSWERCGSDDITNFDFLVEASE